MLHRRLYLLLIFLALVLSFRNKPTIGINPTKTNDQTSYTLHPLQQFALSSPPMHVIKTVHQTWKSKSIPSPYREWRQKCIDLNPDWEFKIWTDEENRELVRLHYPSLLSMYDNYDVNIKRIDSARYLILHKYGGLYMDLDFTCLRPFGSSFDAPNTFYVAEQYAMPNRSDEVVGWVEDRSPPQLVANAFMASPAHHMFLTDILTRMPQTAREHVLIATGPEFLTTMLKQNNNTNYTASPIAVFPMEYIYCQDWTEQQRGTACWNTTSCHVKCPNAITASFWTHSWKDQY